MSRPTVSVIICAYTMDRLDQVIQAVDSIAAQTSPVDEIVLVIDHNEELVEVLLDQLTGVLVVENSEQQGLSGARNSGIAASSGEILAFLDDDARAHPDWIATLLEGYAESDDILGVGGAVDPDWSTGRPDWFPMEFGWVVGCSYIGQPSEPADVRNFIGANMSYRRRAFETAGTFTHGIGRVGTTPLGCEETEFGIRLRSVIPGARSRFLPSARVSHFVGPSRATVTYYLRRCYSEGLSKAIVARLSSTDAALESERSYVSKTLPAGIAANLRGRNGKGGWRRSGMIVAGLLTTTAGYGRASVAAAVGGSSVEITTPSERTVAGAT